MSEDCAGGEGAPASEHAQRNERHRRARRQPSRRYRDWSGAIDAPDPEARERQRASTRSAMSGTAERGASRAGGTATGAEPWTRACRTLLARWPYDRLERRERVMTMIDLTDGRDVE